MLEFGPRLNQTADQEVVFEPMSSLLVADWVVFALSNQMEARSVDLALSDSDWQQR